MFKGVGWDGHEVGVGWGGTAWGGVGLECAGVKCNRGGGRYGICQMCCSVCMSQTVQVAVHAHFATA